MPSEAKGRYFDDRGLLQGSAQPCGCDEGIGWSCDQHKTAIPPVSLPPTPNLADYAAAGPKNSAPQRSEDAHTGRVGHEPVQQSLFPGSDKDRKEHPVWDGVVMYFPRAIREISYVSFIGNQQHNPGQKLHWAKGKSTDQANTAMRHRMDHGVGNHRDSDGTYHMAKVCWRDLAEFETFLEALENQ